MRNIVLCLLVVALGLIVHAQNPSRLDDPIGGELRIDNPRAVRPCHIATVVNQIARKANIPVGVENTPDCWLSPRSIRAGVDSEVLRGMTARQAFDHLLGLMPGYCWQEMDGVVVIRPISAWTDSRNPLNLSIAPLSATNANLHSVFHLLLEGVRPPLSFPHVDVAYPARPIDSPVDVAFPSGTLLDALNAVVRARQGAEWEVGYADQRATIVVGTLELGGGRVMEPLALPQARR